MARILLVEDDPDVRPLMEHIILDRGYQVTTAEKTLVVTGHGLSLKPGSLRPYDYLLKPVRGAELLANIQRCLADKSGDAEIVQFPKPSA